MVTIFATSEEVSRTSATTTWDLRASGKPSKMLRSKEFEMIDLGKMKELVEESALHSQLKR